MHFVQFFFDILPVGCAKYSRGNVLRCSFAFESRLCASCGPQWVIHIVKKVQPRSSVFRRYKTFTVFFSKSLWSPSGHQKCKVWIFAWNFAQVKVSMRIVYDESFNAFGCSYLEIWVMKNWPMYKNDASYVRIGTVKSVEIFTINYSRWDLYLCKVSSQNSNFKFLVTWGVPQGFAKKYSKSLISPERRATGMKFFQNMDNSEAHMMHIVSTQKRMNTWERSLVR